MSQVKTKSPTSEERWGVLGLINGGAAHPFKLAFGGEGNGPVTLSIKAIVRMDPLLSWTFKFLRIGRKRRIQRGRWSTRKHLLYLRKIVE